MGTKIVVELPLVIGVLADLAGNYPMVPRRQLKERPFVPVDRDSFGDLFRQIGPGLNLEVANRVGATDGAPAGVGKLAVALRFQGLSDFTPTGIARQIPALEPLLREREALVRAQSASEPDHPGPLRNPDQSRTVERIAELDRLISAQVAEVIVHPGLQRLEAAWRGLHYLVTHSETSNALKIKVLVVAKQELAEDLARSVECERSVIFQKVYDDVYGRFRGEPFGLLVGDYEFNHRLDDIDLLGKIANVAATSFAPFIAAASPQLLGIEHWGEVYESRDLRAPAADAYARWRSFRDSGDARFVALTVPRVLARPAYDQVGDRRTDPAPTTPRPADPRAAPGFHFDSSVLGPGRDTALWISAAWVYAERVADSFAKCGLPSKTRGIQGGGLVEEWPALVSGGSVKSATGAAEAVGHSPVEVPLTDRQIAKLSRLGLMPLASVWGTSTGVFLGRYQVENANSVRVFLTN